MAERTGHFGEFVRWNRIQAGLTTEAFGALIRVSARRLVAIEAMPEPVVQHTTLVAIAKALKLTPATFELAWRGTAVPITRRKAGPSNDEARLYAKACQQAGVSPAEGMRHVRSWLVGQDPGVQQAALTYIRRSATPPQPTFTDLVDHVQDPAQQVRHRVTRAASAAKSPGPAATGESTHR